MRTSRIALVCLVLFTSAGTGCFSALIDKEEPAVFWANGVQEDVDPRDLLGWAECFRGTYDDGGTLVSSIESECDGAALMLACRPAGERNLTLAAMAMRDKVLESCDPGEIDCSNEANGVGWYLLSNFAWGFAPAGLATNLQECDSDGTEGAPGSIPHGIELESPELRLCWHLVVEDDEDVINNGYRCGHNDLNNDTDWERLVYTTRIDPP